MALNLKALQEITEGVSSSEESFLPEKKVEPVEIRKTTPEQRQILRTALLSKAEDFIVRSPITKIFAGVPISQVFAKPDRDIQVSKERATMVGRMVAQGTPREEAERIAKWQFTPTETEETIQLALAFTGAGGGIPRKIPKKGLGKLKAKAPPREVPQVPESKLSQSLSQLSEEVPSQPPERILSLADDITKTKKSQVPNLSRLDISDTAKEFLTKEAEQIAPKIEEKIGKRLSNKEIIDIAENSSGVLEDAIGREQTRNWEKEMLKLRQRLARAAETGQVTKEFLNDLLVVRTQSADVARKLQSLSIKAEPKTTDAKTAILEAVLDVNQNVDEILKAAEGVDFNDFRQASEFYRKFIAPKAREWIDLLRYNSMLSSPLTHMVNISSNLLNTTLRPPLEKFIAGGIDLLGSTAAGRARTQFSGEAGAYISGYLKSFSEATKRMSDSWKGIRQMSNLDLKRIPLARKGVPGAIEKTLSIPLRALEAADQFFSGLAEGGEFAALKFREKKGVAIPRIEEQALEQTKYSLFRQELFPEGQGVILDAVDTLTAKIESLRHSRNPLVSIISNFTLPFVRTGNNIVKQGIEFTPGVGFSTVISAADKTKQISRALIGTGFGIAAGTLVASNRISWSEPRGEKARNTFREQGLQAYSVKFGDTWYSYQKLPPLISFPLAFVAVVNDAQKKKKIDTPTADVILSSFSKYAEFMADQTYFKGIGDLWNAISGDEFAIAKLTGNYPQQLVPFRALGGWIARLSDDVQRTIDNKAGFIDRQVQLLMLNIPGLRQQLPARTGESGRPIPEPKIGSLSPVRISEEKTSNLRNIFTGTPQRKPLDELFGVKGFSEMREPIPPISDTLQELPRFASEEEKKRNYHISTVENYGAKLQNPKEWEAYAKYLASIETKISPPHPLIERIKMTISDGMREILGNLPLIEKFVKTPEERRLTDAAFSQYPFTDEFRKVAEKFDIDEEFPTEEPSLGLIKGQKPYGGVTEWANFAIERKLLGIVRRIGIAERRGSTLAHEMLHGWLETEGMPTPWGKFSGVWDSIKKDHEILRQIDAHLERNPLYKGIDNVGIIHERFAYLGEWSGGMEEIPPELRKYYERVFKDEAQEE